MNLFSMKKRERETYQAICNKMALNFHCIFPASESPEILKPMDSLNN